MVVQSGFAQQRTALIIPRGDRKAHRWQAQALGIGASETNVQPTEGIVFRVVDAVAR